MVTFETFISICLGVGLAASVGFRVFLPLFALSLASHYGVWGLNDSWQWIGSTAALVLFGVATLVEIIAYYVPLVDNALDSIAIPLATLAGTIIMVSTVTDLNPVFTWTLAIIAGGGTASLIKSSSGATRITSTVSTAGFGNNLVASVENIVATLLSIIAIVFPVVALVIVILILSAIFKLYKKITKKR
jgi:hypothetical protein